MTTKKMFLGMGLGLGLCSLVAFTPTNSNAEAGFCSGIRVIQAGVIGANKMVHALNTRADCPTWPQNTAFWLRLDDTNSQANAMLAAALSAQAIGGSVLVISLNPDNYSDFGGISTLTIMTPNF